MSRLATHNLATSEMLRPSEAEFTAGSPFKSNDDRRLQRQPDLPGRLFLLGLLMPLVAAAQSATVLAVARVAATPAITAASDDPAWESAATTTLRPEGPAAPGVTTTVSALWDDQALFIRFRCTGVGVAAHGAEHDAAHHEGEVVEVFLRPTTGYGFIELQVSPANGVLDEWWALDEPIERDSAGVLTDNYIRNHEHGDLTWTAVGLRTMASPWMDHGHTVGWIADIALPWSALHCGAPRFGSSMRAHFIRIARPQLGMASGYFSWVSVPLGRPHRTPDRMGVLEFVLRAANP